jgi:hypothetical protein
MPRGMALIESYSVAAYPKLQAVVVARTLRNSHLAEIVEKALSAASDDLGQWQSYHSPGTAL